MGYLTWGQTFDVILAGVTFFFCAVIALGMVNWTWRLMRSRTMLRPLVISTGIFKVALAGWAASNIEAILYQYNFPPNSTLQWRIMILVAAVGQTWVIWRMAKPELGEQVILVVEDQKSYTRVVRRILEQVGFVVETVDRGEDALERLTKRRYVAAIMDLVLPDLSGLEVARRARAAGVKIPFIAMSGLVEAMDKGVMQRAGFAPVYLAKPFRSVDVLAALKEVGLSSVPTTSQVEVMAEQSKTDASGPAGPAA